MAFEFEEIYGRDGHIIWRGAVDKERNIYLVTTGGIPGEMHYVFLDLNYQGYIIKIEVDRRSAGRRTETGKLIKPLIDDVSTTVTKVQVPENCPLTQEELQGIVKESLTILGTGDKSRNGNVSVIFSSNWYRPRDERLFSAKPSPEEIRQQLAREML